ncbi:MAG: hypothetical protein ABR521_10070 [Gaiellaceae bacterium]
MRRALAFLSILGLLALALAAAGCGGDDGGGGDRLTKAEYAAQANEICADFNAKIEDLGTPENMEQLADFTEKAIPIFEDGISDLRALNPPEELQATVDRWLESADVALERIRRVLEAAQDGDEAAVGRLSQEAEAAEKGSDALARQIGANTCAEN